MRAFFLEKYPQDYNGSYLWIIFWKMNEVEVINTSVAFGLNIFLEMFLELKLFKYLSGRYSTTLAFQKPTHLVSTLIEDIIILF